MLTPIEIERQFQVLMQRFACQGQKEMVEVTPALFEQLGILKEKPPGEDPLTCYFHVLESHDKLTLFNENFVVWIAPQLLAQETATVTFIGVIKGETIHLELVFATRGVYNKSKTILDVLEKLLEEIRENETIINKLEEAF
ncbi:MAG: hypothetical protein JSR80_06180 [Verrucomicrobia bacterium]|nr:hypothetical protein [Verrucomicrobiota bacterium]